MSKITSIVIPTANRVESLERTVLSYVDNLSKFGRHVEFVVADGSTSPAYRAHTRGLLRSIARAHDVSIAYAGIEEKQRFAAELIRTSGVTPEIVEWGILPESAGANRNTLLLDSVGQLILSADDDTVARVVRPPGANDDLLEIHGLSDHVWDGHDLPADFIWRAFPSLDEATQALASDTIDILDLHERMLGRTVDDVGSPYKERRLRGDLSDPRRKGPDMGASRVMFTMCGLFGDVGVDERWHLLFNSPASREQLFDEAKLRLSLDSRIALKCVSRATLTRWVGLHGMFFGADNRQLLPPFLPILRGQDSLMGWMARQCYRTDVFGVLPRAMLHAPSPRSYNRGFEYLLCNHTLANILIDIVRVPHVWPSASDGLAAMGARLVAVGTMPLPAFVESLRSRWRADGQAGIRAFVAAMSDPAARHLRAAIEQVLAAKQRSRETEDGSLPSDVVTGGSPEATRVQVQSFVRQFGELVAAWPALVAASAELRDAGVRVAAPLS